MIRAVLAWLVAWMDTPAWCRLGQHDPLVEQTATAIFLRCAACEKRTAGWTLDQPRPRLTQAGQPERFKIWKQRREPIDLAIIDYDRLRHLTISDVEQATILAEQAQRNGLRVH